MNIQEVRAANELVAKLIELDENVDMVYNKLGVTFHGRYQPEEILAVVRPSLLEHFAKERELIVLHLAALGVEVEE